MNCDKKDDVFEVGWSRVAGSGATERMRYLDPMALGRIRILEGRFPFNSTCSSPLPFLAAFRIISSTPGSFNAAVIIVFPTSDVFSPRIRHAAEFAATNSPPGSITANASMELSNTSLKTPSRVACEGAARILAADLCDERVDFTALRHVPLRGNFGQRLFQVL